MKTFKVAFSDHVDLDQLVALTYDTSNERRQNWLERHPDQPQLALAGKPSFNWANPITVVDDGNGGHDVTGTDLDDWISGGSGPDTIRGGLGSDRLEGGAGDDLLIGGRGRDALLGGAGLDTAEFSGNFSDYRFKSLNGEFQLKVTQTGGSRADGTDRIGRDVELLKFADRTIDLRQNHDPVAVADALLVVGDQVTKGRSVLANDRDIEVTLGRQELFVLKVNGTAIGSGPTTITLASGAIATMQKNGRYTYDPDGHFDHLAAGQSGTDRFTYTVSDGHGGTATKTVTISLTGLNNTPDVQDVTGAASEDGPAIAISASYTDADAGDTHTFGLNTTGTLGVVTNNNDGTYTYNPNGQFEHLAAGETATDSFVYTVSDGHGLLISRTATVTITGVNDAPVAAALTGTADDGGPAITLTANYTDADTSDTHTFTIDVTGTVGSVVNNNDGTFTYDPNGQFQHLAAGETATDTFQYTVDDGHGGTSTELVTITITGMNDAPDAQDVAANADEDGPSVVSAAFTDPDTSDTHTFATDTSATIGLVANNNDGTFTYDPNGQFESLAEGETATDTFQYTVDDGHGGTSTKLVTVTITGVNDDPIAQDVSASVDEDGPGVVVSASYTDPDLLDTHTFSIDISATIGLVTINNDGTFTYDPNGQFESLAFGDLGTDSFTYTVDDGHGGISTAVAHLTIQGADEII